MKMQVDIYLTSNYQIQLVLQGPAQGVVTFPDFDTFVRFIEGCQDFINQRIQADHGSISIPQPFLDAFDETDNI